MYDAVLQFSKIAEGRSTILNDLNLEPKGYLLATVHRPYNTDNPGKLRNILSAFMEIDEPVIFPVHPRTRQKLTEFGLLDPQSAIRNPKLIDPVGYLDMLVLEQNARLIFTDSGGIQKEAYFFEVPCITLRPETEWVETVETGWNVLVGTDRSQILAQVENGDMIEAHHPELFGNAKAAEKITGHLKS